MREKILKAKKEHPDWGCKKIANLIGCSKSAVKYHLDPNAKEKGKLKKRKRDSTINGIFKRKKDSFQRNYGWQKSRRTKDSKRRLASVFSAKELKEKCLSNPFCYLTGRKIDLTNNKNFELDHIIPCSKGGNNTLENCGLTITAANRAKADLNVEEFLSLCEEILTHNGYKVEKIGGSVNSRNPPPS